MASSYDIALDVEKIVMKPTFNRILAKTKRRRDPDLNAGNKSSASTNTDLIQTCAEACGLSVEQIKDLFCEGTFTTKFLLVHQERGAWLS